MSGGVLSDATSLSPPKCRVPEPMTCWNSLFHDRQEKGVHCRHRVTLVECEAKQTMQEWRKNEQGQVAVREPVRSSSFNSMLRHRGVAMYRYTADFSTSDSKAKEHKPRIIQPSVQMRQENDEPRSIR
jgi:hypothetical protein